MNEAPERKAARTIAWTASTYFGEGLPWSFLHQMATQYLTAVKAPLEQIGYTSWFHLAVTFKFLWSPLVDLLGRKRTWLWVMQVLLGAGMLGVAAIAGRRDLPLFWLCLGVLAVFHATHDVACDGFYMLALDRRDQALYSGARVAAFRAAMLVGSGPFVILAGKTSWLAGFGAAAVTMTFVGLLNAAIMPRPPEPARPPRAEAAPFAWMAAYRTFFAQPHAALVLAFIFSFKLGDIMMFAMSQPLLRDIGVGTAGRGALSAAGIAVFIASTIAGGAVIARAGLERCLVPMTFLQNLAIPLYVFLAIARPSLPAIALVVMVEQLASGVGEAAKVVFLLRRCKRAFSASHYAFATAVVALSSTAAGALSGHLARRLGHPVYFTLSFVLSWPSLVLVLLVPRSPVEKE